MTLAEALAQLDSAEMGGLFPPEILHKEFIEQENDLQLTEETITEYARFCSIPEPVVSELQEAVRLALQDPAAVLIIKTIYRCVYLTDSGWAKPWTHQPLQKKYGDNAHLMCLAAALGLVPILKKLHSKLNISEQITRATCSQLNAYCNNHIAGTGKPGIYPQQFNWLYVYQLPECFMVRLGRFEFRKISYPFHSHVFRHKKTKELVIFANPEFQFDCSGFALENTPGIPDCTFQSVYTEDEYTATGNPVSPDGRTNRETKTINKAEYDLILGHGMPVLDMHIPSGGGMTSEESERSFRLAKQFFTEHSGSDNMPVAIVCSSWIFNPNLPEILPPESNLVRLLKRVHPIPRASTKTDGLWFIFLHEGAFELLKAPRKTSLQKAVTRYLENGGRWRIGGMFLPLDEIE